MTKRQKGRQYNDQKTEGQTIQWPKDRRADHTMTKRQKGRQYNDQKTEGQTIQWPKEKGQTDKQTNRQTIIYKTLHRI